jgi:hypothetical protein
MEARKEIREFVASRVIIPLLSQGESLTDFEQNLLNSTIVRLRSSFLVWESLIREKRNVK